jgi:hydroxypyruvate isomerase
MQNHGGATSSATGPRASTIEQWRQVEILVRCRKNHMPRLAANLSFLFTQLPFLDRFAAAARAGFTAVEFLFPYAWPAAELRLRLDHNGLKQVLFNIDPGDWDAGERGLAAIAGREDSFARACETALSYAEVLGCSRLHAMSGLIAHGARREVYVRNLERAARMAVTAGVDILIEPINTFDMPGYLLTRTADAAAVVADVGATNLGLQLDLYHRHRMEGDCAAAIAAFAPITRHYQIAGPPDRGEPLPSELDVADLFARIDATGYDGWVGCEYRPRAGTVPGLGWRDGLPNTS